MTEILEVEEWRFGILQNFMYVLFYLIIRAWNKENIERPSQYM
jgi:hypothetical protein